VGLIAQWEQVEWSEPNQAWAQSKQEWCCFFCARHVILVIVDKILMEGTSMNFGSALSKMMAVRRLIDVYKLPNSILAALMIKLLWRHHKGARFIYSREEKNSLMPNPKDGNL
jgi:hypothetical protein